MVERRLMHIFPTGMAQRKFQKIQRKLDHLPFLDLTHPIKHFDELKVHKVLMTPTLAYIQSEN